MLAVTTRNRLRSWRYCVPMMRARGYVQKQLVTTPGLIRYVSAIASPTEFLTMTVWENRQSMFDFMSSGAHQEFMWMFSRWSSSFWSMRWIPTGAEDGVWEGLSLSNLVEPEEQYRRDERPQVPPMPLLEQQQGRMSGGRLADPGSCDVYAITALVEVSSPEHYWKLLRIVQEFLRTADHTQLLRWNVAVNGPGSFWILTLWRNASGRPTDVVQIFRQRLGASWTMCWEAGEYEIGNWNGLRLRQLASARSRKQRMADKTIEQVKPELS